MIRYQRKTGIRHVQQAQHGAQNKDKGPQGGNHPSGPTCTVAPEHTEANEEQAITQLLALLPPDMAKNYRALFDEMAALQTPEARLVKALDKLEVLLAHNEAPLSTWIPKEYTLNLSYGQENVAFSNYLTALREEIRKDSEKKIQGAEAWN